MPPPPVPRRLVTRSSARNPLHATRSTQPTPCAKTALPAHDRPPTPALVRKTALPAHDNPRHQHWCAKRPSLLTIDPRHQHWCAKRPSLLTIDPRHQQPQPFPKCNQVCVNNHGSQLILHEYIKRTSSHPESDRRTCILLTDCLELRLHKQITQPCRLNQERQRSCARKASSSRHGLVRGTFLDRTHLASRRRPCGQRRSWRDGSLNRC